MMNKFLDRLYWLLLKYKYAVQNMTISFLLINFMFLYAEADFKSETDPENNVWVALWFVIEAWLYVLFALICTALNYRKSYRAVWGILALFLTIRAVWTISAVTFGVSINEKLAMACMFYLTCLVICIIAFYPQITKLINLCQRLLGLPGRWRNGSASQ